MLHNGHSANQARYRVRVDAPPLRFAAAHFATFGGDAEPLHGHNYQVTIEVEGDLTADAWVIDFGELRALGTALCRELDHRFLLPEANRHIAVAWHEGSVEVRFGDRRYVFPAVDVARLPVENSTAECLARYLAARLAKELRGRGHRHLRSLTVGVEEAPGQSGWCTIALTTE